MMPKDGAFAGDATGSFDYALNGVGFLVSGLSAFALIGELGYSALLDDGELMERTDAQGSVRRDLAKNTVIGSLMTDGSDGGPWLVNLGVEPALSAGVEHDRSFEHNRVVGVTSWTSTSKFAKEQGASPFTTDNIQTLVNEACAATPRPVQNSRKAAAAAANAP
jgi:hypothetical protein